MSAEARAKKAMDAEQRLHEKAERQRQAHSMATARTVATVIQAVAATWTAGCVSWAGFLVWQVWTLP